MTNQTKNYQTKNDHRTRRSWKPGWPECRSHGKVKTNARVRGKASKLHTCIPSVFPWTKSATPRNSPDRGKTSTASHCLAPVKSQEQDQDRHASLPSRSSVDRQDGADGCAVSDTGPVKTAADQVETDPCVESQGRSQAQLALQRSADFPWLELETNRKRTGEWNGKDLPAMCDKNVPAKTLPPSAFRFGCARWRVERSHDVLTKAPFEVNKVKKLREQWAKMSFESRSLHAPLKLKVSSDTIIRWGATLIFKLSKMKLFRASQSSVVHVEAVLTSNQYPV